MRRFALRNYSEGYKINERLSGLLVYQKIMPSAERLSSKFHSCPRSFASRLTALTVHFSDSPSALGIIRRYTSGGKGFIYWIYFFGYKIICLLIHTFADLRLPVTAAIQQLTGPLEKANAKYDTYRGNLVEPIKCENCVDVFVMEERFSISVKQVKIDFSFFSILATSGNLFYSSTWRHQAHSIHHTALPSQ